MPPRRWQEVTMIDTFTELFFGSLFSLATFLTVCGLQMAL
jgi:hypothetical protein